ncbi:MAG: DUF3617 family protein [Zoogloeaceae bacterium]|nr:DUF3617 family protein [Zoogloeaceae bacterium]
MPRTRPGLWEGTTEIDTSATHQALKDGKNKNPGLYNQVVAESAKEGIKLDADASTWLSSNPDDKKIEFTDSAATGRHCITDTSPQSYEQCPGCSTRTFRSLSSGNRFKITVACSGGFSTEMGLTFHSETDYTVVAVVNSPMGSVRIPQRYRWLSHTCGNVSVGKPSCPDGTSPQRR